ncbi:auxin canalization protein [Medicago truncatula]|uniref:Auxin canalization protein n=1 Tax=Medicago truncatula TaxID=3880 RepID=A0A072U294_MEDTR|nr:auxin canalization protein [Medicago truncatula]
MTCNQSIFCDLNQFQAAAPLCRRVLKFLWSFCQGHGVHQFLHLILNHLFLHACLPMATLLLFLKTPATTLSPRSSQISIESKSRFSFAYFAPSQLVLERIMSHSVREDVSPLTSDRISLSSEPLNHGGALAGSGSPPICHSDQFDDHTTITVAALASIVATTAASSTPIKDEKIDKTNMDIASAAILVTVQCVEAAKAM